MRAVLFLLSLSLCSCFTSHTTYQRSTGTLTRTVAFGPAAAIKIDGSKIEATTIKGSGAAVATGAFTGAALGGFFRSIF